MIQINDLHKSFKENKVLKGINENIKRGEVVVIIGPSGSGKSTFLRCLNLLEVPTSGEIIFEGTNITDKKTDINKIRDSRSGFSKLFGNEKDHINTYDEGKYGIN